MGDTTGITLRLPPEMAEALRTYAFVTDTSVNETIKQAVAEYLQRHGRTETVEAAFQQVLAEHQAALEKLKDL